MATNAAHTVAAVAEREEEIIKLAIGGTSPPRIARLLSLDVAAVRRALHTHARRIREASADRVAIRFLRHDEILTRLIDKWAALLAGGFDRDVAAALLKAMERQSRLLGLDVTRDRALPTDEWIAEQSDAELAETLRTRYGVNIPHDLLNPSRN